MYVCCKGKEGVGASMVRVYSPGTCFESHLTVFGAARQSIDRTHKKGNNC